MDERLVAVKRLDKQANLAARVIEIPDQVDEAAVDEEEEVRAVHLYPQPIFGRQIERAAICALLQGLHSIRRAFEKIPGLGRRRDDEGIILRTRPAEDQAEAEVAAGPRPDEGACIDVHIIVIRFAGNEGQILDLGTLDLDPIECPF